MIIDQTFIDSINEKTKHPLNTIKDFNFVSPNTTLWMFDQMFQPIEQGEKFIIIQPNWLMAHVLHNAGLFNSVGDARKNGWNKPIPDGFSNFIIGKKKIKIFTYVYPQNIIEDKS